MASASGAQREPSMEEILASIRRIIEDNETTNRLQAEAEAQELPSRPEYRTAAEVVEVSAFRSELRSTFADGGTHGAPTETSLRNPFPSADRAAPDARAPLHDATVDAVPGTGRAVEDEAYPGDDAFADNPALVAMSEEMERAALETMQARVDEPEPVAESTHAPAGAEGGRVGAILSERAGRQVAAAFGELSEAFAASRRRSFDEMAEEMMRPMLQDWLDNNLPTMVERLVREEIERIARGS